MSFESERSRIIECYKHVRLERNDDFGDYLAGSRESAMRKAERTLDLGPPHDVLEVGCGHGGWLARWPDEARLAGIDLVEERIRTARERLPGADLRIGCATELPWTDASFDRVLLATVMSSVVDDPMQRAIADETWRVLRPGGAIACFDMRVVRKRRGRELRKFDEADAQSLWASGVSVSARCVLAPPISRALAPISIALCHMLESGALRTHHVTLIMKPA